MATPMVKKGIRKPKAQEIRSNSARPSQKTGVRPQVSALIGRVIKENAPTWEALAKR